METLESTNSKLRIAWVKQAIDHNMSFQDYRMITEWLDCFQYVLPEKRKLSISVLEGLTEKLLEKIKQARSVSISTAFSLYLQADLIETTLTIEEQKELMPWMSA